MIDSKRISHVYCFFFSSRRRHTRCSRDWSSDVCSSDLFTSRRTAEQQRNFAVGLRVLGKIVVKRDGMPLGVAEKFAHGAGGIWRDVLKRSRLGSGRSNDDGVVHRPGVGKRLHDLRDRRALLPDAAINANYVAALLIDDGVENDRGLAGLAVADDQLALSAADRNHAVDRLDAGLQRLTNRLAVEHAPRDALKRAALLRGDGALSVHRLAEPIHDAGHQRLPEPYR